MCFARNVRDDHWSGENNVCNICNSSVHKNENVNWTERKNVR